MGVPMASYFDSLCSAFSTCLDFFFFWNLIPIPFFRMTSGKIPSVLKICSHCEKAAQEFSRGQRISLYYITVSHIAQQLFPASQHS